MEDEKYIAPAPTPEQLANAKEKGYDPLDRCGEGFLDQPANDSLAAACTIHDEEALKGGTRKRELQENEEFDRNIEALARAIKDPAERDWQMKRAKLFEIIVDIFGPQTWHREMRDTPITELQGEKMMEEAQAYIDRVSK